MHKEGKSLLAKKYLSFLLSIVLIVMTLGACAGNKPEPQAMSLKIGLMPAVDAAPFFLAEEQGYYDELGLQVELQLFNNAQDRQSALQTQSIDGAISDLIAVATNVDAGFKIKATTMTNGIFPILMRADALEKQDLKVGMMEVSVTNFLVDEWLGEEHTIEKVYINDIPARLSAIGSGHLDMGIFPEPLASMGELQGLKKLTYPSEDKFCPDVLVFTEQALVEKDTSIAAFHKAYNKAIAALNADPQAAKEILLEKIPNLKEEIRDSMALPQFTNAQVQDEAYIEKIIQWTEKVIKKDLNVTAADLVERKYSK